MPVGVECYISQPLVINISWYKTNKGLKKQGVPETATARTRAPKPQSSTKEQLALRLLRILQGCIPRSGFTRSWRMRSMARRRLSMGPQPFSMGSKCSRKSAARWGGVWAGKRDQHVADYFATHPGTPYRIRIQGSGEVGAADGSARLYVCALKTKRFIVAIKYAEKEEISLSDCFRPQLGDSWILSRAISSVGYIEGFFPEWKSHEG